MFAIISFEKLLSYIGYDYEICKSKGEFDKDCLALHIIDNNSNIKWKFGVYIYNLSEVQDKVKAVIDQLDCNNMFNHIEEKYGGWGQEIRNAINNPKFYVDISELYNRIYELCPLTDKEIRNYCLNQGTGISYDENNDRIITQETIDYWRSENRIRQFAYAVRTNMDLLDYDEWQAIETKLFGQDSEELNALTACRINHILWTDMDVTPLDLI